MLRIYRFDNTSVKEDMKKFEEKYGIELPQLYSDFLEKYNGGNTPKTTFNINGISSDLRSFYCFGNIDEDESFSFLEKNDLIDMFLDKDFCPIATDSLGNEIVIGIGKKQNGKIYFFDSEISKFTFLSKDLLEFIDKLKSKKFVVRSIEERIQGMKEVGSKVEITDGLIALWQEEIDRYSGKQQEIVEI